MTMTMEAPVSTPLGRVEALPGAIDCDVHPCVPGMKALLPYLDEHWAEQVVVRGIDGLESSSYPSTVPALCRPDWRVPGQLPGESLEALQRDLLEPFGLRCAIGHCLHAVQGVMDDNFAVSLARAVNDWMAKEWLDREPRLRASIVVTPQDPEAAAAEIERLAADRRFVQVLLLAMGEIPLGKRFFWPIYRAAERHGLPIGIHAGSSYRQCPANTGWPSFYLEEYVDQPEAFQNQVLSLVCEGVFTKFPGLKVVLMESGFAWLPGFMWRATKTWRGTRMEYPWVDRPPAQIIREHFRVTLQPADTPPTQEQLDRLLEQVGDDRMLLFSTDYPHWHFDGRAALPDLPPDLLRKVCIDNPLATFPRLEEAAR